MHLWEVILLVKFFYIVCKHELTMYDYEATKLDKFFTSFQGDDPWFVFERLVMFSFCTNVKFHGVLTTK
jgi:hypothetical protein